MKPLLIHYRLRAKTHRELWDNSKVIDDLLDSIKPECFGNFRFRTYEGVLHRLLTPQQAYWHLRMDGRVDLLYVGLQDDLLYS